MVGTLLKVIAYTQAPRTTFTVLHPKNAVRMKKMGWDMRHSLAPRVAAVGAAAIALPLGIVLTRTVDRFTNAVREARATGQIDDAVLRMRRSRLAAAARNAAPAAGAQEFAGPRAAPASARAAGRSAPTNIQPASPAAPARAARPRVRPQAERVDGLI